MKKAIFLPVFLALLWALPALTAETPAVGQQGRVLRQTAPGAEGQKPASRPSAAFGQLLVFEPYNTAIGATAPAVPENKTVATGATATAGAAEEAKSAPAPEQKPNAAPKQDTRAMFKESLRQLRPLDEGQLQEYRERSAQRERTLHEIASKVNYPLG